MPYLDLPGLRVHMQELGPRDGPPVVMVHGLFSGNLAAWYFTSAPALSATHRVRLLDLRGHGLTERTPTGYGRESMISDLAAATGDLEPFALVGHSYGALLSLRFALAHPGRVTALAMVDPPLSQLHELHTDETAGSPTAVPERWRSTWTGGPSDQVQALLHETTLVADLDADEPIADAELLGIACPALFLFGSRSPWAPGADRVARLRPDLPCQVLDGGHDLQLDAKAEVSQALTTFLAPANRVEQEEEVPYG